MKRFLAPLTVALLLGLVAITFVGGVAWTKPPPTGGTTFKFVGAGDIADVGNADLATGNLIDAIIAANPNTIVFTTGDNAYPSGSTRDFWQNYHPTWGPFKSRTRPSPGNQEYQTPGASGYKNCFQGVPGVSTNPTYYAYNLGNWRIYSLDSNSKTVSPGFVGMHKGSAQYEWLANDLTNNPKLCVAAYWHHPTASSGPSPTATTRPIFELLDDRGAELVLTGHDHLYERYKPIDSNGVPSPTGVVEIVVGTGGAERKKFTGPPPDKDGNGKPDSVRNADTHGILELTLSATGYKGRFVPAQGFGNFTDSFSGKCKK